MLMLCYWKDLGHSYVLHGGEGCIMKEGFSFESSIAFKLMESYDKVLCVLLGDLYVT